MTYFEYGARYGYSRSSARCSAQRLAWAPSLLEFEWPVPKRDGFEPPLNVGFDAYFARGGAYLGSRANLR